LVLIGGCASSGALKKLKNDQLDGGPSQTFYAAKEKLASTAKIKQNNQSVKVQGPIIGKWRIVELQGDKHVDGEYLYFNSNGSFFIAIESAVGYECQSGTYTKEENQISVKTDDGTNIISLVFSENSISLSLSSPDGQVTKCKRDSNLPDSNDICNEKKQIENEQKAENYFKTSIVGTYVIDREQIGQKNIQVLKSSLYPESQFVSYPIQLSIDSNKNFTIIKAMHIPGQNITFPMTMLGGWCRMARYNMIIFLPFENNTGTNIISLSGQHLKSRGVVGLSAIFENLKSMRRLPLRKLNPEKRHILTIENKTTDFAQVRIKSIFGGLWTEISLEAGIAKSTHLPDGNYYEVVRYGKASDKRISNFQYSIGEGFILTAPSGQYKEMFLTLRPTQPGNYQTFPASSEDFK
jgi:hypothetical protein